MIQRQPFNQLFLIMATAAMLVSALSIFSLYLTATEQHRLRLLETARWQARQIESLARIEGLGDGLAPAGQATLESIIAAQEQFEGWGESGEFLLATRDGDRIHFLLNHRHSTGSSSRSIPFSGEWAVPMQLALSGISGVSTGIDYRGVEVLAAHVPIPALNLGLVIKMDTSEIRNPFIYAALVALAITLLVIFLASRLFFRLSRPIEDIIDQQAETFRTLAETMREGIVIATTDGTIQFANRAAEQLFGYRPGELHGMSVKSLMPVEQAARHDGYMQRYLQTGFARIIGSGRQLVAKRKDGSQFPIYLSIGDIHTSQARLFAGVILDTSEQQQLQRELLEIPVSEQRRIGQELHDGLGQQLTGLGLLATSLVNKASKPEHRLATQLAEGLQQAIAQVRALSRGLMPVDIDAEGFIAALENLVREIRAHCSIPVSLTINERIRIVDNSSALHLYRITQEALNNAIKHANASHIEVSVGLSGKRGFLSIHDDGQGFEFDVERTSTGLGLRIMRHRCGLIDAECLFLSSAEHGTEVRCYFAVSN